MALADAINGPEFLRFVRAQAPLQGSPSHGRRHDAWACRTVSSMSEADSVAEFVEDSRLIISHAPDWSLDDVVAPEIVWLLRISGLWIVDEIIVHLHIAIGDDGRRGHAVDRCRSGDARTIAIKDGRDDVDAGSVVISVLAPRDARTGKDEVRPSGIPSVCGSSDRIVAGGGKARIDDHRPRGHIIFGGHGGLTWAVASCPISKASPEIPATSDFLLIVCLLAPENRLDLSLAKTHHWSERGRPKPAEG